MSHAVSHTYVQHRLKMVTSGQNMSLTKYTCFAIVATLIIMFDVNGSNSMLICVSDGLINQITVNLVTNRNSESDQNDRTGVWL